MLIRIPAVLSAEQLRWMREKLTKAGEAWVDGRATAGHQGTRVKHNLQLNEQSECAHELGDIILSELERNALFISAVLPNRVYPPMFNCYESSMQFGNHVDGAVRLIPGGGSQIRTDVSATLFLTEPDEYEGGELVIEDTYGAHAVKLPAGDMIVYPSTALHRVNAVTQGTRLASFFWIQSMVRDDAQRMMLFEMDSAIQRLTATGADETACVQLTGCYHNLLRKWADV
ncbi:MAG: Fe2+-dependent dioxygenase [Pseudomonadota bacterium]